MEFDVLTILPATEGEDLESGAERLLAGFETTHPEAGAVTSVDLTRSTYDVAFTVEAEDLYAAIELARAVFTEAAAAAQLKPRPLEAMHVDAAEATAADAEAVPA